MQLARTTLLSFLAAGLMLIIGCEAQEEAQPIDAEKTEAAAEEMVEDMSPRVAMADLQPLSDSGVSGTVSFTTQDGGTLVEATVEGFEPNSRHGFHIHENGDCGNAGQAAGGHFAPQESQHGAPSDPDSLRHVGDFGNLEADDTGAATYSRLDSLIAFEGPRNIIGKAVIVHGEEDDLESQPSGAAGPRIACGIIEMAGTDAMEDDTTNGEATMNDGMTEDGASE
jgi:Cu-Zn family superoxide dismutase